MYQNPSAPCVLGPRGQNWKVGPDALYVVVVRPEYLSVSTHEVSAIFKKGDMDG
jgi:hypothetical protein